MARIVGHLPAEGLETRYRAARDATAARHCQAIRLPAQGRTILEVAEVPAFVPRRVTRLAARYDARGPAAPRPRGPAAPRRSAMGGGATARPPACSPRTCWPPWPSG
jgi:hypothetical protein